MSELAEYFAMGGYAAFVWPAYGVAALVLIALAIVAARSYRARQALLTALREQQSDNAP
jgi:heme exporter protein D